MPGSASVDAGGAAAQVAGAVGALVVGSIRGVESHGETGDLGHDADPFCPSSSCGAIMRTTKNSWWTAQCRPHTLTSGK